VLLPLGLAAAVVLMSQGVIQNFKASETVTTLEGATQKIPQGPIASQEAIKELGTNGGGFFNANSAHPYENPTPFTNLLQMFLIFALGAGLTYTLGSMTGKTRHGWAIFWSMSILFLVGALTAGYFEVRGIRSIRVSASLPRWETWKARRSGSGPSTRRSSRRSRRTRHAAR
jgi:K+-transporting ATPase ATPase A chain